MVVTKLNQPVQRMTFSSHTWDDANNNSMIECCVLKENILVGAISGIVPLSESPLFKLPFCVVGARGLQKAMFMRIRAYLEGWNKPPLRIKEPSILSPTSFLCLNISHLGEEELRNVLIRNNLLSIKKQELSLNYKIISLK